MVYINNDNKLSLPYTHTYTQTINNIMDGILIRLLRERKRNTRSKSSSLSPAKFINMSCTVLAKNILMDG